MRRSENNGKVDVAMRFSRAWSAPAAPLSHIRRGREPPSDAVDSADGNDADEHPQHHQHSRNSSSGAERAAAGPALPHAVYHLFPTQTCFTLVDVPYIEAAQSTSSEAAPSAPLQSNEALRAELQAAKHQILLLTSASAQSFSSYATLEAQNAELRLSNEQLRDENEAFKA